MTSGDAERRARFDVLARASYAPPRSDLARRTEPSAVDDVLADTLLVMWRRLDDVPDGASPDLAERRRHGAAPAVLATALIAP